MVDFMMMWFQKSKSPSNIQKTPFFSLDLQTEDFHEFAQGGVKKTK